MADEITMETSDKDVKPEMKSDNESSEPSKDNKKSGDTADEDSTSNSAQTKRRVVLSDDQTKTLASEISSLWSEQNSYVDDLENQLSFKDGETKKVQESLALSRKQFNDSQHRQRVLAYNLSNKNQELNEVQNQLGTMLQAQVPSIAAVRNALYDPVVSTVVQKLREELSATKTKLEETQNELSAWKFTPDSNTGKRLMAKCRLLYQENEELGKVISSGRIAKLEGELALQKSFSDEIKKSQSELDEFLQELDEDMEGMQGTIYFLQQQLKTSKETLATLQQENAALKKTLSQHQEDLKNADSRSGGAWDSEDCTRDSASHLEREPVPRNDDSEDARELPNQGAAGDSTEEPPAKKNKIEEDSTE